MQETQVRPLGQEDPPKGNAMRSSILDWRIPRTEEPGGPQSMGLQRVRHDWVCTHTQANHATWVAGTLNYSQVRQEGGWPGAPAGIWSEGGPALKSEPLSLWRDAHSGWVRVHVELNSATPYWCLWRSGERVGFWPPYFSLAQSLAMGSAYPWEISF